MAAETAAFGIMFGLMAIAWLVWMALFVFIFVFWILMIVDVVKRQFPNDNDRIVWVLVVILAGIIGAIIYYFIVKKKDKKENKVVNKKESKINRNKKIKK